MAWSDLPARPNILLIITDQMRYPQHWPPGWADEHLPSLARLRANGMDFRNAFCAANECSPSRSAFVTSTYPQENGIIATPPPQPLPVKGFPSLGKLARAAGYQAVWKGKWHLGSPKGLSGMDSLRPYHFHHWDPPDAGTTLNYGSTLGGGTPNNDLRFATGKDDLPGQTSGLGHGTTHFLHHFDPAKGPFFLVASLVNPHDVHVFTESLQGAGYPYDPPPDLGLRRPHNHEDSLANKPQAQAQFLSALNGILGPFTSDLTPRGLANFYAWLQVEVDRHVMRILDKLEERGLTDSTLVVRFGDHGEMGASHGLREKMYVAYEEAIRVPFVFSNPLAFPEPQQTDALASLLDLLPTLAAVMGRPRPRRARGKDLGPVLADPAAEVQHAVVYTYDDGEQGVSDEQYPIHIRTLRKHRWKYSVYVSEANASLAPEFELYDLHADRGELTNLLNPVQVSDALWQKLHRELTHRLKRHRALPTNWPATVGSGTQAAVPA